MKSPILPAPIESVPGDRPPKSLRCRAWVWLLLAGLAALVWFSLYLAAFRIYQVDECTETFAARTIVLGELKPSAGPLFQLALSWLARGAARSADFLASARFVMVEIFWLNLVLIALATGERLRSRRGLIALAGAATLAPLWDYGFEIRHDNLLLTGLLLIWCAVRVRPKGPQSFFVAGALAVGLQFVGYKAFAYTAPLSLAVLAFPPPGHKAPRWKLAAAWALGAFAAFLLARLTLGVAGLWEPYVQGFRSTSSTASGGALRFGPGFALARLLNQTPLLLAVAAAGLLAMTADLWRRGKAALTWDGNLPEALLLVWSLAVLCINPSPFPYNLLHLVPFAFLFGFRHAVSLWQELRERLVLLPMVWAVVIFAHLAPFGVAARRHLAYPNTRQEKLMSLAEELTDPRKDSVYDGIGMVNARPVVGEGWFLHRFTILSFLKGPGPRVREVLAAHPAAVYIPNYRTDWLPEEDDAFIRQRYVSLADDLWVLGKVLPAGGGAFEIVHPGRYRVAALEDSNIEGTYPEGLEGLLARKPETILSGTLDDVTLTSQVMELAVGTHRIQTPSQVQPAVVWVGPKLDRPPRPGQGDHRQLFVNWY